MMMITMFKEDDEVILDFKRHDIEIIGMNEVFSKEWEKSRKFKWFTLWKSLKYAQKASNMTIRELVGD